MFSNNKVSKDLLEAKEGPFVSIFLNLKNSWPETQENTAQLKSLCQKIEEGLKQRDCNKETISKILKPARERVQEGRMYENNANGLIFYLSPSFSKIETTHLELENSFLIGDHFDVKPLLQRSFPYCVLALNEDTIKVLKVEGENYEEVSLAKIPKNFSEFTAFDEHEKSKQQHSTKQMSGPDHYRHGHGGKKDYHKIQMKEFCKNIENEVTKFMNSQRWPLFVVGANRLASMYKEVNGYSNLIACEPFNFTNISDIKKNIAKTRKYFSRRLEAELRRRIES